MPIRSTSPGGMSSLRRSVSLAGAAAPSAVPNSNIVAKTGRRVNYHPKALSAKITTGRCTKETEDLTITNTTERSQTITLDGSTFVNLRGEQQVGVCFPHRGVYLFGLAANPLAKLVVTAA